MLRLYSQTISDCGVLFEVNWPVETQQKPCRDDRADFEEEDIRATPSPHNIPFNYFYNASEKVSGNYAHSGLLWCWRDFFFYSVVPLQGWINLHSTISKHTHGHTHTFTPWWFEVWAWWQNNNVLACQGLGSPWVSSSSHPDLSAASVLFSYNMPPK